MTVQKHALRLELTGWVKNLPNGRVEILVIGPKDKIITLCVKIEEHFEDYIQDKDIRFEESSKDFQDFRIAY